MKWQRHPEHCSCWKCSTDTKKVQDIDLPIFMTNGKDSIICGGCKKIIINKDGEDMCEYISNCCYSCEFRWWCYDCCVTYYHTPNGDCHRTCGITLMERLLNPSNRGGRYGGQTLDEIRCLQQHLKKEMKYGCYLGCLAGKTIRMYELLSPDVEESEESKQYKKSLDDRIMNSIKSYLNDNKN